MAAALRAVLLMTLMPAACYGEILAALFGTWRCCPGTSVRRPTEHRAGDMAPRGRPRPVLRLQDMVLQASDAEHLERDYLPSRSVTCGSVRSTGR